MFRSSPRRTLSSIWSRPCSEQEAPRDQELFRRVKWLEDSDRQNRYYQRLDAEELDPLAQVGTDGGLEESLSIFSSARSSSSIWMSLPSSFCATCPPVWTRMGISASHWTSSPGLLASPKGGSPALWSYCAPWNPQVCGASSLSQCLELQLLRIHEEGPALAIVRDCLEELAKNIIMPSPPASPSLRRRSGPPNG